MSSKGRDHECDPRLVGDLCGTVDGGDVALTVKMRTLLEVSIESLGEVLDVIQDGDVGTGVYVHCVPF